MLWLIPVAGTALAAGAAIRHHKKTHKKLTADEEKVYTKAYNTLMDPAKLNALADKFAQSGHAHEADMLRKRAKLRALPPEVKKARRDAFKKALKSTDKAKVLRLADLFHNEGAVGAATKLRSFAKGLVNSSKT
jgi:hypothetical protein